MTAELYRQSTIRLERAGDTIDGSVGIMDPVQRGNAPLIVDRADPRELESVLSYPEKCLATIRRTVDMLRSVLLGSDNFLLSGSSQTFDSEILV